MDLNSLGFSVEPKHHQALRQQRSEMLPSCEWLLLGGQPGPGLSSDFVAELLYLGKRHNCQVELEVGGYILRDLLADQGLSLDLIQPNDDELALALGSNDSSLRSLRAQGARLLTKKLLKKYIYQ